MCSRALEIKPAAQPTIKSVNVHWIFGVYSPNQIMLSATIAAGKTAPSVIQVNRSSWEKRCRALGTRFIQSASCGRATNNPISLKPIMLQPAVKRAATKTQRFGRLARVAVVARQRLLDEKRFHFFQANIF